MRCWNRLGLADVVSAFAVYGRGGRLWSCADVGRQSSRWLHEDTTGLAWERRTRIQREEEGRRRRRRAVREWMEETQQTQVPMRQRIAELTDARIRDARLVDLLMLTKRLSEEGAPHEAWNLHQKIRAVRGIDHGKMRFYEEGRTRQARADQGKEG